MKWQIRKCCKCGAYTLKGTCLKCSLDTMIAHPPKFSPADKYARLRKRDS